MNGHWWTERVWPGFVGGVILLILLLLLNGISGGAVLGWCQASFRFRSYGA